MAKTAEETLRDDFEKLKSDMASLADDLRKLVKQQGNGIYARSKAAAEDAVARGRAAAEELGDHLSSTVTRQVTERPMTSVAVSFLAGLIVGAIVRR
ncbi:MAG TPA: hypothetical protein VJL84_03560 [Kiloniellales bacterium]|nr:hypothetical protein [Kiloniellales bacterium]